MAAKKGTKRPRTAPPEDAVHLIATALASHESSIRQLAEVVVNLHANLRAIREVVDALADGATGARVVSATQRLRRVKLDE